VTRIKVSEEITKKFSLNLSNCVQMKRNLSIQMSATVKEKKDESESESESEEVMLYRGTSGGGKYLGFGGGCFARTKPVMSPLFD
jgi:hypothetical protein